MIRFLLTAIVISFFATSSLFAKKTMIETQVTINGSPRWEQEERSLYSNVPLIFHDGSTLYIYSDVLIETANFIFKDHYNNTVYSSINSILSDIENIFELNIGYGKYVIELEYKETVYYGYFEITE